MSADIFVKDKSAQYLFKSRIGLVVTIPPNSTFPTIGMTLIR